MTASGTAACSPLSRLGNTGPPPVKIAFSGSGSGTPSISRAQTAGGATTRLTPKVAIWRRIRSGSSRAGRVIFPGGSTLVAPAARLDRMKTGREIRSTSSGVVCRTRSSRSCCSRRKPVERTMPLGRPVDPEVKVIRAGSSSPTDSSGPSLSILWWSSGRTGRRRSAGDRSRIARPRASATMALGSAASTATASPASPAAGSGNMATAPSRNRARSVA